MSFFKKLVGRTKSDEKDSVQATASAGSAVSASVSGETLPKDPMSPARVKPHFSPDVTSGTEARQSQSGLLLPEVVQEMSPEAHDASGLLEDDDEFEDTIAEPPPSFSSPVRLTSSYSKDGKTPSYAKDDDAQLGQQVGYSWAKTNSWMSEQGGPVAPLVDYGGGKGGGPSAHQDTTSFRSDVTDYDSMYPTPQATAYQSGIATPSGLPPGFSPSGHGGLPGMPPPMAMSGGYPAPMWGWPAFPPMDPSAMMAGMPMGFPQGQPSAEDIDAYAEKMMMAARMMQAAAAAQRQQSKAVSSTGVPGGKRGSGGTASAPPVARHLASEGTEGSSSSNTLPQSSDVKESERTTVMLRNIPNDYSRDMLLALLDEEGFKKSYNFVYLPQDFKRRAGLGYAFINIVSHDEALRCMSHFSGFNNWKFSSQKVCEAAWGAPLQGLDQHICRYKNSPLMHPDVPDEFKPVLFQEGVRIEFPPPSKRIRPPRMKLGAPGSAGASGLEAAFELEGDEMM